MKLAVKLMSSAAMALGLAGQASAAYCTLSAVNDQCVINWNVSAPGSTFDAQATGAAAFATTVGNLSYAWFDGLNATGAAGPSGTASSMIGAFFSATAPTNPIFDDGRVSLVLTLITPGLYDLAYAKLTFTNQAGTRVDDLGTAGTLGTAEVPVAPTLALVLAGLGAMSATRRRAI